MARMRILITGAAAGLAQRMAVKLAQDGHDVVFTFRPDGTPPDRTLELLRAAGLDARAHPVEFLGEEEAVAAALGAAVREPVDALVHAVGPMVIKRFEKSSAQEYREMIDGNLRSAVIAARTVLPAMRERGFGRLVFFALNGSSVTRPMRGLSLHAAAKAGLVAFARTLAVEEAKRAITVNVLELGDIRKKTLSREEALTMQAQNPRGRPGTADDVAAAVRFFLERDNDFITGAVLAVTGGLTEPYERSAPPS
jgi:3-oxoacyl-[acyl-carrier protein] reductase